MNKQTARLMLKRWLHRAAPKAAGEWQERRHRRHIRRFEQRIGLPALVQAFVAKHGQRVLAGPFQGMAYVSQATGSALIPKLLGSYESELHGAIEQIIATDYAVVIDIGCAEGYYANGLALRLPAARIYAFDIDPEAQALCREMARLNSVEKNVEVFGECRHDNLNALITGRSLVVCDCEGYEAVLLQPALVPALAQADILVELHEEVRPGLTSLVLGRLAETHQTSMLDAVERKADEYERLHFLTPDKRPLAVSEFRSAGQQWAFCQAKCFGEPQ